MTDFNEVFAALRTLMLAAGPTMIVARDDAGDLVLHESRQDPKTRKPIWFGAVAIKKSYVAFHLFPLYEQPALGDAISPALAKRRQGKSCFNFKTIEPDLFDELAALTHRAANTA